MDVSQKFESQPTKAQVNSVGNTVLNSGQPWIPSQNITVSFVRLQDTAEYSQYSLLLRCGLCDTIKVIFPEYNSSGTFKIVKTVWDVLLERYEEMELGQLSTSLSEALGISADMKGSSLLGGVLIDTKTSSETSVPANGYNTVTIDVSKSECTPLGIIQIGKSGSAAGYCVASNWTITSNTATIFLRNTSSNAASVTVSLVVLYRKG
jgi:hypothetical protein